MNLKNKLKYILTFFLIVISQESFGQSKRSLINDGVDQYKNEKFAEAEESFRKGLDKEYESFVGHFNLGDALYKQENYQDALKSYQNAMAFAESDFQKSKVYHNVGNTLLKAQKVQESIEAYKNSLRLDPDDLETKYNLSYALNMLKQNQDQQQQQQNQDQNKDKQDQQQNQDQQNQDQNKDEKQDQKQNQDQQQNQNQQQQQQQKKNEISKEEAERILQALKNNEEQLQKELRKKKGKPVKKSKDW